MAHGALYAKVENIGKKLRLIILAEKEVLNIGKKTATKAV